MSNDMAQQAGDWRIALYYCYFPITHVENHISFQQQLCILNELNGRVRVSLEGINGVLSGRHAQLKKYEELLRTQLLRLNLEEQVTEQNRGIDLDIKYCHLRPDLEVDKQLFHDLSVKAAHQVVSLYETKPFQTQGVSSNSKRYYRRRRRNRRKHERYQEEKSLVNCNALKTDETLFSNKVENHQHAQTFNTLNLDEYAPAQHLSPREWNEQLESLPKDDVIILDARNVYESRVGYFSVDGVPTLLTNTRKYSSLPSVMESNFKHLAGKHVFMYCTGGVRCEQASVCLQAMAGSTKWSDLQKPKGVYQLEGGIQKYLEQYGTAQEVTNNLNERSLDDCSSYSQQENNCLYKGKNFVFDPRRTDGVVGRPEEGPIGNCLVCQIPHDDYDNGHAPCEKKEARCCRCRILILVCNQCRMNRVRCWGEAESEDKVDIFCGEKECVNQGNIVEQAEIVTA